MTAKLTELTMWLIALIVVGSIAAYVLKRLFNSGGSVARDFEARVREAEALSKDLERLKKESTRGTADFNEALKRHRAKFGTRVNPPPPDKPAS